MDFFECSPNNAVIIEMAKQHYGVGEGVEIADLQMLDLVICEEYWATQISGPWFYWHELVPVTTAFLDTLHPKLPALARNWRTIRISGTIELFPKWFPLPISSLEDFYNFPDFRWEHTDTFKMTYIDW